MAQIKEGDSAPLFTLMDQHGKAFSLAEHRGKKPMVLFFYPKDNSMVCTAEACSFRDAYEDFVAAGAEVIGISADDADSHQNFASKHRLPFILLSDTKSQVRSQYGVSSSGVLSSGRVTFVIDKKGVVRSAFASTINIPAHIQKALKTVQSLVEEE